MDRAYESLEQRGTTLANDLSLRMQTRPSENVAFEDWGATAMRRRGDTSDSGKGGKARRPNGSQDSQGSRASTSSMRDNRLGLPKSGVHKAMSPALTVSSDDSGDEMNCLSPRPARKPPSSQTSVKSTSSIGSKDGVLIDGDYHPYHPDFPPEKKLPLSSFKFKKKTKVEDPLDLESKDDVVIVTDSEGKTRDTTKQPAASSSTYGTSVTRRSERKPVTRPVSVPYGTTRAAAKPFKPPGLVKKPGELSQNAKRFDKSEQSSLESQSASSSRLTAEDPTPRAQPAARPKPRSAYQKTRVAEALKASKIEQSDESDISTSTKGKEREKLVIPDFPMRDLSPLKETSNEVTEGRGKGGKFSSRQDSPPRATRTTRASQGKGKGKSKAPEPFPMPSPLGKDKRGSSPEVKVKAIDPPPFLNLSPVASSKKVKDRPVTQPTPKIEGISAFPALSPLSSPLRKDVSQNTSQGRPSRARNCRKATIIESSDEDDIPTVPRRKPISKLRPEPFPMETQMLASISRSPATKRGSSEGFSSDDGRREYKRPRASEILREIEDKYGSDDDFFLGPGVDPSTLCPWCDEELPPSPSPHLLKLMSAARARSSEDPRTTNPLGLHAPATVFINVCQRHRFESHHFPLAKQKGWPISIEWDKLGDRVQALAPKLQRIVDDVDERFLPGYERPVHDSDSEDEGLASLQQEAADNVALLKNRARKGSTFWLDAVQGVKQRGFSNAAGVRAQMADFSKTQPGYYGELGSMILSQTLYDMFPPAKFAPAATLPLTPTEFIQRILLPEAAVLLIMDDMDQSREEAIITMRESAQFGVAMFPDDHADIHGAGEQIVKKRAEARRKEIDIEEGVDASMSRASTSTGGVRSRASSVAVSETEQPTRRNTSRRATQRNYNESSDSDIEMMPNSDAFEAGVKKGKKPRSKQVASTSARTKPAKPRVVNNGSGAVSDAPPSSNPSLISNENGGTMPKPRPKPRPKMKAQTDIDARSSDIDMVRGSSDVETSEFDSAFPPSNQLSMVPSSSAPRHLDLTQLGGRSQAKPRVLSGSSKVDIDATPRAVKVATSSFPRMSNGSSSSLSIEPISFDRAGVTVASNSESSAGKTPRANDAWSYSLRDEGDDDDEDDDF